MAKGVPAQRPLDLNKPFLARAAEAVLVSNLGDERYVFDLIPTGARSSKNKKTIVVDKMGCDFNGGQRTVWNSDVELPKFKIGDTVFALRLASAEQPIIRGEVKGIEGKHYYLIRVPFEKNLNRDDGLFKVAFTSTLGTLAEVRAKVDELVETLRQIERVEAITATPAVEKTPVTKEPASDALKKGWLQEAFDTHTQRSTEKQGRRIVRGAVQ